VLAFDFGTRRIGVAMGNTVVRVAHPLKTIAGRSDDDRFAAIQALLDEWKPAVLLVGRPVHADGTEHEMTAKSDRFARQLGGRFKLPVARVDERFTTEAATIELQRAGVRADARRAAEDAVAAKLMLQAWFDDMASP
jgi:putative Holliday junction resolvase